ncbi:retrotransposon protein, putative, ty1-copia subclass [Tanacetum coccineum]|uniref:Retrotransposon protein, putative, ty1-copia subclass n=1 Tax=Tanacetum coccineum TaxID=301880 RepID=A0ABQ5FE25_9ASTR
MDSCHWRARKWDTHDTSSSDVSKSTIQSTGQVGLPRVTTGVGHVASDMSAGKIAKASLEPRTSKLLCWGRLASSVRLLRGRDLYLVYFFDRGLPLISLVDLLPNCKTIVSKWLFKKKTDMDGNIHIKAISILIAIAAYYDYEIWQMDVKTAFLNGYLNEDGYMVQPKGFVNPKHPRRICKL